MLEIQIDERLKRKELIIHRKQYTLFNVKELQK